MTKKDFILQYTISQGHFPSQFLVDKFVKQDYLEDDAPEDANEEEVQKEREEMLDTWLDRFPLNHRAVHCLFSNGIYTVRDVLKAGKWEILKIPGLGKKTINEIEHVLESLGVSFQKGTC